MCVILSAIKQQRPSEEMVRAAWKKNDDGGGIAYREKEEDGTPVLVWKKNLNLDQMIELCGKVELPYIAHFRIASSGGIRPELCHPFPINHKAPRVLEGKSKDEYVLFHNGDWREWQDFVLKAAVDPRAPELPAGKWNDTRGMSWLASIYGIHFMDLIEHKGVAFSATDYEIFLGKDGWKEINGVWCSNDYFWSGPTKLTPGPAAYKSQMCMDRNCSEQFGLVEGYCSKHESQRHSFRKPQNSGSRGSKEEGKKGVVPSPIIMPPNDPALSQEARVTDGDKSKKDYSRGQSNQQKKDVICLECRALLSLNQSHTAGCSKGPGILVPGMVCSDCQIPAGRAHLTTCKVVYAGYQCYECKQQIRGPKDHLMNCSHFDKAIPLPLVSGNTVNLVSVPGGAQRPNDPFHVILTAAMAWKEGRLSLQELKIVKKRLGFQHLPTKDVEKLKEWATEQRRVEMLSKLKDPRMEPVTMVIN